MFAPIIEKLECPRCTFVSVFQSKRSHAACNARVIIKNRCTDSSRIGSIEMCQVQIGRYVPAVIQFITQPRISPILLKFHIGTMTVCPVIRSGDNAVETSFFYLVGSFGHPCVIRTISQSDSGSHSVFPLPAGYDVDYSTHGIRAIKYGCGAAHNFHFLGQHRLVSISNGMSHQSHVLGMPVNQYQ